MTGFSSFFFLTYGLVLVRVPEVGNPWCIQPALQGKLYCWFDPPVKMSLTPLLYMVIYVWSVTLHHCNTALQKPLHIPLPWGNFICLRKYFTSFGQEVKSQFKARWLAVHSMCSVEAAVTKQKLVCGCVSPTPKHRACLDMSVHRWYITIQKGFGTGNPFSVLA